MRARIATMLLLSGIFSASTASAQTPMSATPHANPQLDAALTWDGARGSAAGGNGFWMQGAGFQLESRFWRGLGVVADIAGTQTGSISGSGPGLDLITVTFGPRYTWSRGNVSLYGQGLLGQAFAFSGLFPSPNGTTSSDNSLAALAGGGVNLALRPRLGLRLLEADWLRTQLPNSSSNTQSDLRLSAGLLLRFR